MNHTRADLRMRAKILRVAREMIVAHSQEEFNAATQEMRKLLCGKPESEEPQ
jgi:hypothetical protein